MPYFVFTGHDRSGKAEVRSNIREDHRAYIRQAQARCRVVAGGPLTDDQDETMFGTLLVLEADDRTAAMAFLAGDPYAKVDLFETTQLHRWRWGLGNPP